MHVDVASLSEIKLGTIDEAADLIFSYYVTIEGHNISSDDDEQPANGVTLRAVKRRLVNLEKRVGNPKRGNILLVIESGIFRRINEDMNELAWFDKAIVLALLPNGERICRVSQSILFPENAVNEARKRGFKTTLVGDVLAELNPGCNPKDPQSFLTDGTFPRKEQLLEPLIKIFEELKARGY
jgi:hypothetical protein